MPPKGRKRPALPPKGRKRKFDLDDEVPKKRKFERLEVVRPSFWKAWSQLGKSKRRDPQAKEAAQELKGAYDGMVNLEGELTFNQQRHSFEYVFWPPLPRWCLIPFDCSAKPIVGEDGRLAPVRHGLGPKYGEQMWKTGVLGVFYPARKYGQLFDHLLIPVYFPWQDDTTPDGEVRMFGPVHLNKDNKTACFHVMTEWQKDTYDKPEYNKLWTDNLVEQLTSELGLDKDMFSGKGSFEIKYLPNHTGPAWQNLGWTDQDMKELSKPSFYYIVFAATQLAVHGVSDTDIPDFDLNEVFIGLAQALYGVSTALDIAAEDRETVRDGVEPPLAQDASDALQAHREWLDRVLPSVVEQYDNTLNRV